MTWPTFVILGALRTGATARYAALRQHPSIGMSRVKEPNFFAYGEISRFFGLAGSAADTPGSQA